MKAIFFLIFISAISLAAESPKAVHAESPESIIQKADAIRNPDNAFVMRVEVDSTEDDPKVFEVWLKGNTKTFIKTLKPERDKDHDLLMVDESMWAYIPNLKRAIRVSLSQKLTGQAANGDISRTRWARDYEPKIESETPKEWVILLTAKKKGLTYEKIRAHVAKETFRPVTAEYLTASGKPLKKAAFTTYKVLAGAERPSEIRIEDAVRPSLKSTIKITSMTVKPVPENRFSLEQFGAR